MVNFFYGKKFGKEFILLSNIEGYINDFICYGLLGGYDKKIIYEDIFNSALLKMFINETHIIHDNFLTVKNSKSS